MNFDYITDATTLLIIPITGTTFAIYFCNTLKQRLERLERAKGHTQKSR